MIALALVVFGFLLGSVPAGVLVSSLFFRKDLRAAGSGNIGAANAMRTLGRGAGAAVLLLDAAKGFIPTIVAHSVAGLPLALAAGFAAIVGHCYSPWLRFKGGKGVATELGVLFALSWQAALIFMGIWGLVVAAAGYASVGSLSASLLSALTLWVFVDVRAAIYGACAALLIVWRHRENLQRLREGRENRLIGASSSASNPGPTP